MTIDLCVWDRCNNKCLMCTNPERPWPAWDGSFDYGFEAIIGRLEKDRDRIRTAEAIYLTGGEPTLHPRFLDILKYLVKNFPDQRLKLLTNGRRFAYADFTREVLAAAPGLEVEMSLCGPNAKVHDGVTQARGSFEQAKRGLGFLLANRSGRQAVGVRTVLSAKTYRHIGATLRLFNKNFRSLDRVIVIFLEFEAQALKNSAAVGLNYGLVRPYIDECLPLLEDFRDIRFYHFPLCVVGQKIWPYLWRTLPKKEVSFLPACRRCRYKKFCLGVHKGYLKSLGRKDFSPIRKKIDFEPSGIFYRPIKKISLDYLLEKSDNNIRRNG